MKKIAAALLAASLVAGTAAAQNKPAGLVLTTPGLQSIAPAAFQGGVGLQLPMGSFDLRPYVGFNTASTSNGVEQSTTAFDFGVDLLLPLSGGFFSTYYGGGVGLGLDRETEEVMGGKTTTSSTAFTVRGIFGLKCEPVKHLTIGTEIYLNFQSSSESTEYSSLAKAAAPLSSNHSRTKFYLAPIACLMLCFWFDLCPPRGF
ncbi:hypothetical protein JXO52_07870 [bacterium]|nr:hypothetical protein [bacterium]